MIMSTWMKRYKETLAEMPEPILLSEIHQKMDLRGLMQYAKEKGVRVSDLSEQEKRSFLLPAKSS